jgi:hypothetical protein
MQQNKEPQIHSQPTFNKGARNPQWRKDNFFQFEKTGNPQPKE